MPRIDIHSAQSPYDLLGVSPADDFATIRAAWCRLVKSWHPDVWHGTTEEATRRMLAVNDAYDRISVMHKRVQEKLKERHSEANSEASTNRPKSLPARLSLAAPKAAIPAPSARPFRRNPAQSRFDAAKSVFGTQQRSRIHAYA